MRRECRRCRGRKSALMMGGRRLGGGRAWGKDGGRRTEGGGQKTGIRAEGGGRRGGTQDGGRRTEGGGQKTGIRAEGGGRRTEGREVRRAEGGGRRTEGRTEDGGRRTEGREVGRRAEGGGRRTEGGVRRASRRIGRVIVGVVGWSRVVVRARLLGSVVRLRRTAHGMRLGLSKEKGARVGFGRG